MKNSLAYDRFPFGNRCDDAFDPETGNLINDLRLRPLSSITFEEKLAISHAVYSDGLDEEVVTRAHKISHETFERACLDTVIVNEYHIAGTPVRYLSALHHIPMDDIYNLLDEAGVDSIYH